MFYFIFMAQKLVFTWNDSTLNTVRVYMFINFIMKFYYAHILYILCLSYIFFNVSDVRIVPQLLATPTLICLQ